MKRLFRKAVATMALMTSVVFAQAQAKDIVDVAASSEAHTTFSAAIKASGLQESWKGKGPYTVFAPTNDAFSKLPEGALAELLKPENKAKLASILNFHVIPGKLTSKDVMTAIKSGNGKATVKTAQGGNLTLSIDGGKLKITDEAGGSAFVTAADLDASNGVIHVIDGVVAPK
jgi:uncharacterized surface protein with fasciclin (FAS1) repeats